MAVEEGDKPTKGGRVKRRVIGIVVAVAVVFGGFVGYSVWNGDLAPADAAAKYAGFHYLSEDEVSDYIMLYREQMGLAESSDEDWATFLAAYNMTPNRLRHSTIRQLVKDDLVEMKAAELGISASDEEVEATIDTMRESTSFGDDDLFMQTLEAHGQTLEGLREVYRHAIMQRLMLTAVVDMPEPTEEQVKEYMKSFNSTLDDPTVKHTYCFKLSGLDEGGSIERISAVQELAHDFQSGDMTADAFAEMVKERSDDQELIDNEGANGWNVDTGAYSDEYLKALNGLELNDVSPVFREGDSYAFIWVNDVFTLPTDEEAIDALDPDTVPASLWDYLSDKAAYGLWEEAGEDYLEELFEQANIVYYPMPSDVPYNVDMSLADVQYEEVDENGNPVNGEDAASEVEDEAEVEAEDEAADEPGSAVAD